MVAKSIGYRTKKVGVMAKLLSVLILVLFSQLSSAHGGRLNSEGCHDERKTGGYHCLGSTSYKTTPQRKPSSKLYNRDDFNYRSYRPTTWIGFYTGQTCSSINIDHVVSLKDAHDSGAYDWSPTQKAIFGNDRDNHVPSCRKINSSKGSAGPESFLRRSRDGKGLDYKIVKFCKYVEKYYTIKRKYGLSLTSNNKIIFSDCGFAI